MLLSALFPWPQRHLILQFSKREILARYRGSILGLAWVVINPLVLFGVQSFIFKSILEINVPNYSLFLLGGLLPWIFSYSDPFDPV